MSVLGIVATFFSMLVVFVASPFHTQLASADGAGLNPSLQSFYFQIPSPLLYLGYVGLTVPFAFAMGALLSGRPRGASSRSGCRGAARPGPIL